MRDKTWMKGIAKERGWDIKWILASVDRLVLMSTSFLVCDIVLRPSCIPSARPRPSPECMISQSEGQVRSKNPVRSPRIWPGELLEIKKERKTLFRSWQGRMMDLDEIEEKQLREGECKVVCHRSWLKVEWRNFLNELFELLYHNF